MGQAVVPMFIQVLQRQPGHWFMPLSEFTGADPIAVAHRGRVALMAEDWVKWAKAKGIV